jgi:hypothetical protein
MSGEDSSNTGHSGGGIRIGHDYNTNTTAPEKSTDRPFFNGDYGSFSFWKTMMYSHIIGVDDELWDKAKLGY